VNLALRLTLLLLLLRPLGSGWLRVSFLVLAVLGLAVPRLLHQPALWLALAALAAWRVIEGWPLADNHAYLLTYWCLAVALAQRAPDPARVLAWNGRVLVGLAFAFATSWTLLSPDYLDGRFFRVTLVADERLEHVATRLGGIDRDALLARRAFVASPADAPVDVAPEEPARLRRLALFATWLTLALEAAVAIAFLAPSRRLARLRHPLLLVFCASTFAVAPVVGFGWLLLAMGVTQCDPAARRTRLAYLGVFALLIFYAVPAHASTG
jgi:hypothetical protein